MRPHVFIGGVPGAGKTTLGDAAARAGRIVRVGAGQLIKAALRDVADGRVRVLDETNARRNQVMLVTAFEAYCREARLPVLLDGHFIVPTERGPDRVAIEVFRDLKLDALLLVTADPAAIADRLRARPEPARWWDGSVNSITSLQEAEMASAHETAQSLGLPIKVIDGMIGGAETLDVLALASRSG